MHPHTPSIAELRALVAESTTVPLSSQARARLGWIVHFADHGHSVSETCAHFGISRGTFHLWMERFDPADILSLEERSHQPHGVRKPTVPPEVVAWIRDYRTRTPHIGKQRIATLLRADHQTTLSPSTIGRVIERECLYFASTPHHWRKRLERQSDDEARSRGNESAVLSREPLERAEDATEQSPVRNARRTTQDVRSETQDGRPCSCFFCRLRTMNWRPWLRSVFVLYVFVNIALLTMLVCGVLGNLNANRAQAINTDSPSISILTQPSSLDAQ